jgi:hypothetical protein
MAIVSINQLMDLIRGSIGRLVFRVRPDGTVILSGAPRYRKGKASPAQKAHRQRVKHVGPYARHLSKIHPIYAQLAAEPEAKGKWLSAYNFAFADCMKPPVIDQIERREGCIRVQASDNVMVTRVWVFVLDESGKSLDTGDATRADGDWWEYATQAAGQRIRARAFDLPGNCTELEVYNAPGHKLRFP